jgi:hypothetical protein
VHLPVPFAADDPRSAALVLRVPAPKYGETPAVCAAKHNGNAAVKAFFASGQVRPIRVQSEVTLRGHQRARGGHQRHSVAIRGLSEASQRHAERPSEAIRGHSEALTGHQRALRGHPWPSFAISSTQAHSVAIKRAPGPKTATMVTSRAERAPCACCVCACSQHLKPAKAAAAAADKAAADKAAADKAAVAKAPQEADGAQLAAALAASLAVSGHAPPPSPPTTLATSRFMESYNQPKSKPDQLYALMTTDCHRLPPIARAQSRTVQPHMQQLVTAALPQHPN